MGMAVIIGGGGGGGGCGGVYWGGGGFGGGGGGGGEKGHALSLVGGKGKHNGPYLRRSRGVWIFLNLRHIETNWGLSWEERTVYCHERFEERKGVLHILVAKDLTLIQRTVWPCGKSRGLDEDICEARELELKKTAKKTWLGWAGNPADLEVYKA